MNQVDTSVYTEQESVYTKLEMSEVFGVLSILLESLRVYLGNILETTYLLQVRLDHLELLELHNNGNTVIAAICEDLFRNNLNMWSRSTYIDILVLCSAVPL